MLGPKSKSKDIADSLLNLGSKQVHLIFACLIEFSIVLKLRSIIYITTQSIIQTNKFKYNNLGKMYKP